MTSIFLARRNSRQTKHLIDILVALVLAGTFIFVGVV